MVRLVVLIAFLAAPAHANVGSRRGEGAVLSEPGGLREVTIEHEELRFDLRPITGGERLARVAATYHLDHRGTTPVTAQLIFVSGGPLHAFQVAFDGVPLESLELSKAQIDALPAAWRAPIVMPDLDGGAPFAYEPPHMDAVAFSIVIEPGKHLLAATYRAPLAWSKSRSSPTIIRELGYILAPARDWGAFGTLDIVVDVPPAWRVATSPRLVRTGDTLRGRFPALPADTFGITLQARPGLAHQILEYVLPALALLVLLAGGFVMYAIGRARGRKISDLRPLWPVSLPAALVWAVAIAVSGGFAAISGSIALPEGESASHGYGPALGIMLAVFVALLAIPAGVLIARAGNRMK
jgi:hypothetical protein